MGVLLIYNYLKNEIVSQRYAFFSFGSRNINIYYLKLANQGLVLSCISSTLKVSLVLCGCVFCINKILFAS